MELEGRSLGIFQTSRVHEIISTLTLIIFQVLFLQRYKSDIAILCWCLIYKQFGL